MKKILFIIVVLFVSTLVNAQYTLSDEDVVVNNGLIESCSYDFAIKDIIIPEVLDGQTVEGVVDKSGLLYGVFYNKGITSVEFPSTMEYIGNYAFRLNAIESLMIPANVKHIGRYAFHCNSITSLIIEDGVDVIMAMAFSRNRITNLNIPSSISTLGDMAFSSNNINNVNVPSSVIHFGRAVFNDNEISLYNGNISEGIIYGYHEDGSEDNTRIVSYGGVSDIIDFIPLNVKSIDNYAFWGNKLIEVIIPSSVVSICDYAFDYNDLTAVSFEQNSNIESIGVTAFDNSSLTSIELPTHVSAEFLNYKDANGNTYLPGDIITDFETSYETVFNQPTVTYVPDDNFEQELIYMGLDDVLDDYVATNMINQIPMLRLNNKNISDLTGIEDFTALMDLQLLNNQITILDVSHNTALVNLECSGNELTILDVSQNQDLTKLWCIDNNLTNINFGNISGLTILHCGGNQLESLNVAQFPSLSLFGCSGNQLTSLDVSNNTALKTFYCYSNKLTTLDVSQDIALTSLNCSYNYLTFESLEPAGLNPNVTDFTYFPQLGDVGTTESILKNEGENFSYELVVGGEYNQYQWYKNGVALQTQTSSVLELTNLTEQDRGYIPVK